MRKYVDKEPYQEERIYFAHIEINRKFEGGSLTIERETVHVGDDAGRIAMLEKRTYGVDDSEAELTRYIYSNHLQSSSLELDAAGQIISYEEYHPYGTTAYQAKSTVISAAAKRYRYTGKERDEESGFYYHGARYYIPWLGRWTACDPLESEYAGLSAYHYGFNNPVIYNDPSGMEGESGNLADRYFRNIPNAEAGGYDIYGYNVSTQEYDIYIGLGEDHEEIVIYGDRPKEGQKRREDVSSGFSFWITDPNASSHATTSYYHRGTSQYYSASEYIALVGDAMLGFLTAYNSEVGFNAAGIRYNGLYSSEYYLWKMEELLLSSGGDIDASFYDLLEVYGSSLVERHNTLRSGSGVVDTDVFSPLDLVGAGLGKGLAALGRRAVTKSVAKGVTNAGEMLGNFGIPKYYTYTNGGKSVFVNLPPSPTTQN